MEAAAVGPIGCWIKLLLASPACSPLYCCLPLRLLLGCRRRCAAATACRRRRWRHSCCASVGCAAGGLHPPRRCRQWCREARRARRAQEASEERGVPLHGQQLSDRQLSSLWPPTIAPFSFRAPSAIHSHVTARWRVLGPACGVAAGVPAVSTLPIAPSAHCSCEQVPLACPLACA